MVSTLAMSMGISVFLAAKEVTNSVCTCANVMRPAVTVRQ
jgi:hypothetical protein